MTGGGQHQGHRGEGCRQITGAANQRKLCSGERMSNGEEGEGGRQELWKHKRLPVDQRAAANHISKSVFYQLGSSSHFPRPTTCQRGSQDQARQLSNIQPKHDPEHVPATGGFQPQLDLTSHLDPDFIMSQCPGTNLNGTQVSCPQFPPRCGTQNSGCFPTSCGIH